VAAETQPPERRELTMSDVALAAGVSRATVSRVLQERGKYSPDTRSKVLDAVGRLGYVPNVMASGLASRTNGTVGLLLRDAFNPAYGLLFTELQNAAHEAGISLVSMTVTADPTNARQLDSLNRLIGMRVAGLIVATGTVTAEQLAPFSQRLPILRAGRPEPDPAIHAVSYAEENNARKLAGHVASFHHPRAAVLIPPAAHSYPEHIRGTTMAAFLEQQGVDVTRLTVIEPNDGVEAAAALAKAGKVTAIMCPTDKRQLAVIRALKYAGLAVPGDVSVSGCDGVLPGADLLGLTTLRIPVEQLARRSIEHMATLIAGEQQGVVRESLEGRLVPGSTVGPPAPLNGGQHRPH
jgi:DNA-binding LacI/PurR family transcriptional regulator